MLEKMLKDGVVDYYNRNNEMQVVTTSDQIRKFLKGEDIIVKNRNIFENYRKEISEFYDFIEKDGRKRFPEVYKKTFDKTEIIKQLIEEVKNLNYYEDSNKIYKVEQKFKMIIRKYFDSNIASGYLEDFQEINFDSMEYVVGLDKECESNFNNNKKKLVGLLNVILDELNLENNMQDKKENINTKHSQENAKNNKNKAITNNDATAKNNFFWNFIIPLAVAIIAGIIIKQLFVV